jgi:8-oxo-dGTP pyrophosphatase MutT (NUDIX family)
MEVNDLYYKKYLKYKIKYLNLQNQIGGRISNVAIALFFKDTVYLVQEKNGEWNLPGGKINEGETESQASIREFDEETGGFRLDTWTNQLTDEYKRIVINELEYGRTPHTKIFLYYLEKVYANKPNIIFKQNSETINGDWFNIKHLPDKIKFRPSMNQVIRKYNREKEKNNMKEKLVKL